MDQVRKNEIVAVVLFAVSLFLFLSIFSFSEQDLSFYTSNPNLLAQDLTGIVGAYTGGSLRFLMGNAAYVIPLLALIWGVFRLLQVEEGRISFKFFGMIVLIAAVSAGLSMMADLSRVMVFSRGGLIGTVVSEFLLKYLGRGGAAVFIVAMIILSVLVATEFLILPVMVAAFKFAVQASANVRSWISKKAERSGVAQTDRTKRRTAREEISKKLDAMRKQVEEVRKTSLAAGAARGPERAKTVSVGPKIVAPVKPQKVSPQPVRAPGVTDTSTGKKIEYELPSLDLLKKPPRGDTKEHEETLKRKAAILEKTLLEFEVDARVVKIKRGPVVTLYELELAPGTRVNKITPLSDDISLAMRAANVRIVAPLPGRGTVGIEVPNDKSELVLLRDIMETVEYGEEKSPLKLALGKDISGAPIITDLTKMPHLLIAGTTGSGKTVCINGIISSLLFNSSPDELKFLMIDPKRVELMIFEGIPHLISPIVTNPKKAAAALNWVVNEMERRYEIFAGKGVRNIAAYKEKIEEEEEDLPYILVVVDELADLMQTVQQDVEGAITRIAQLSRAAGIHMILATQRPSVNVITGVIKANFPARISFQVTSKVDSRTVLDANGAEKLLGRGDMLFMEPGESALIRGQCSLVEDVEIKGMVSVIKAQAGPQYDEEILKKQERKTGGGKHEKDELFMEAVKVVINTQQASVSMIQRRLRVGYTRAARMIDVMEEEGIVGPYNGSKPREILIADLDAIEEKE
jgi:S-DNA-T family DNA segregation ATPase FtsK/SpoIIIE